jgi:single-stranded DNA-specific DHH superfamily exonuclease
MGQRIILFGDYDADGITAVAQVHRFLAAAGFRVLAGAGRRDVFWFVPDRLRHGYGLTKAAVEECLATCREEWARSPSKEQGSNPSEKTTPRRASAARSSEPPILMIALDCGSASLDVIAELGTQGIDCIVVDHHQPPDLAGVAHPAAAHLNPHAWAGDEPGLIALRTLSASGLAFYLCAELARDLQVERWDRAAGLVLAGLGTVADVVPLCGPNRMLVRAALRHANETGFLEARLPGLAKLHEFSGGGAVDARTFGYRWGPRVNASGRIENARETVELLLVTDPERIAALARACEAANEDRKDRTARMLDEALRLVAERERSGARDRVLVLWDESWEPGIVGIVAGRLREQRGVPTIIFGRHRGEQAWKGSGRSVGGYDLGAEVRSAVEAGLVLHGGGHPQAAGLTVACGPADAAAPGAGVRPAVADVPGGGDGSETPVKELETLRAWFNDRCSLDARDLEPVHEILAPVHGGEAMDRSARNLRDPGALVRFWCELYDRFEPFGAGNPRPGLLLRNAELVACQAKTTMKGVTTTRGAQGGSALPAPRVWALSARFRFNGGDSLLADWTDPDAAGAVWPDPKRFTPGTPSTVRFDLVLEPHRSAPSGRKGGDSRTWYDWRVVACARCEPENPALAPGTVSS